MMLQTVANDINSILEVIEIAYDKNRNLIEEYYDDNNITHNHTLYYKFKFNRVSPQYEYVREGASENLKSELRLTPFVDSYLHDNSFIYFDNEYMYMQIHPKTIDELQIRLRDDTGLIKIKLKEFLTEEVYFMYSTVYQIPGEEEFKDFLCQIYKSRGKLLKNNVFLFYKKPINDIENFCTEYLKDMKNR